MEPDLKASFPKEFVVLFEAQFPRLARYLNRLTGDLEHTPPVLKADRLRPPPPSVLGPGAFWSGTIMGSEVLRRGSVVRVLFGPYSSAGERFRSEATEFFWVTDHSVRLR